MKPIGKDINDQFEHEVRESEVQTSIAKSILAKRIMLDQIKSERIKELAPRPHHLAPEMLRWIEPRLRNTVEMILNEGGF